MKKVIALPPLHKHVPDKLVWAIGGEKEMNIRVIHDTCMRCATEKTCFEFDNSEGEDYPLIICLDCLKVLEGAPDISVPGVEYPRKR